MKTNSIQKFKLLLMVMPLLVISSCFYKVDGVGPIENSTRSINSFSEITVEIPANITIVIADSVQCVISAQKNITELIETEINGDELIISSSKDFKATKPINIVLSTRSLAAIRVDGSGDIKTINTIKGDELYLNVNGSGNIDITAEVNDLKSKINGSGDVKVSGKANNHNSQINGSGNLLSKDLITDKSIIKINGSGDAFVNASLILESKIVGSGNIKYSGSPTIKTEITGSGEVSKNN